MVSEVLTSDTLAIVPEAGPAPESYELPRNLAQTWHEDISTVLVDSIAGDTVTGRLPHFIPVEKADSMRVEALIDSMRQETVIEAPPSGLAEGLPPLAKGVGAGAGGALTGLLAATLVLAALNASSLLRTLKHYRQELWSVRKRNNAFDDESSATGPASALLAIVFVIFGGIVLYYLPGLPPSPSFAGAAAAMTLLGGFYIFRYCAYSLVGYAFANDDSRRRWIAGYMAVQAYTGLFLIIPALLLVYMPEWRHELISISLTIYLAGRILFIIKGFRIFYRNFRSLLYFILYLCTLEIIPLLALYALCTYLWSFTA